MILIVDDKQENLFSLKSLLQLHLYEVDTASSGEEALKKILKTDYALIILDVQMPGMDGYEVAETIKGYSRTKNTPILFLSAVNIDKRFITRGYASGGVDYVTKPFDPDLLMLKVKTFTRLYEQTQEMKLISEALKAEVERRKEAQKELEQTNFLLEDKVAQRTAQLLLKNEELEGSNAELQQFASVASHDLQEPLRKIITFSTIIQEKHLHKTPEALMLMDKVMGSTMRMRNLIDDLLNYSRLSSAISFVPTDLNKVLKETLSDLELSIRESGATITADALPCAEVIPGQIRQLFQNILSNSLKFARKEAPPVVNIKAETINSLSLEGTPVEEGDFLRLSIADNGIGFNPVYAEKIFTIFQRLHGRSEYEGTGIGLAIVKKIVEKHNGLIAAKGKEGEGALFIIVLPLKANASLPAGENPVSKESSYFKAG
jgi:signal transduction histidine kinase